MTGGYPWLLYINTQATWNSVDHREFGTFQFTFPHTQQLIVQLTKDKGEREGLQNIGHHQRQDKWNCQPQDVVVDILY